jgi:hypothetical protein
MVFRRFSFLSRGDSNKDRASAIPMVSHVDWWTLATLLYQATQPSGGFGQARRLSAQESKSMSWLTNGILLASQEIKSTGLSWKRGPRQKEFGSEGCGKRISDTWRTEWKPNNRERSFNFSCLNNHSKNSVKVEVLPWDQRWPHQC